MSSVHNTGALYRVSVVATHNTLTAGYACACSHSLAFSQLSVLLAMNFIFLWKMNEICNIQLRYIHNTLEKVAMKWMRVWLFNLLWLVTYIPLLVEPTPLYSFPCIWLCIHALLRFVMRQTLGEILSLVQHVPISRKSSIGRPTLRIWHVKLTKMWSISPFACRVSSGVPTNLTHCSVTNTSQLATRCDTSFSSPSSEYM